MSLLLATVTCPPLAFWLPVINVPFVVLGYRQLGRAFAIRSALAIGALAGVLAFLQYPTVTQDRLLDAVFGGFFLGAGIGLAVRGGAVLDGTEIAALLISKRSTLLRVGDVILGIQRRACFSSPWRCSAWRRRSIRSSRISPRRGRSTSSSTASRSTPP